MLESYNNVILMRKDKDTGFFTETIGSYEIHEHIEYIDKIYAIEEGDNDFIYLTLTTADIDEDYMYNGIFDLYNTEIFAERICEIEESEGDYNPKWILKIEYMNDIEKAQQLINEILHIHAAELKRIIPLINKDDYTD